ncbi:uncharacterized protein LOC142168305 [Nicotiana tabacum]|uniref:Uncharacterized protein LOC142168305 n=1 Tax=Nicotiana tabacum TaxID=4097 RepID=A0AC58SJB7_TOBAC
MKSTTYLSEIASLWTLINYDASYGEAQGLLAGYCGLLAIDGNFFPINFDRTTNPIAYRYCNVSLNKKWATHRHILWDEFYDPAKSRTELLSNVLPDINGDQWASFAAYHLKSSTIESCRSNKEIRRKQTIPHTGGSKANSRRRHELFLKTGENPTRRKIFIETHKRRDGSFVNDEARTIVVSSALEQIELTQGNTNESEISPDDIIGNVLGAEHSGRLRYTLTALKAYMISKEERVFEQFAGLFSPQPQPSHDEESEPTSPVDVRESSGSRDENRQENIL